MAQHPSLTVMGRELPYGTCDLYDGAIPWDLLYVEGNITQTAPEIIFCIFCLDKLDFVHWQVTLSVWTKRRVLRRLTAT